MTETLNDAATDPQQTIAELQRKLAERTAERDELQQQQTATAEVLRAISYSAFDLDTVLSTLISTAVRLCNAGPGQIFRRDGDVYRYAASQMNVDPDYLHHEEMVEIRASPGTLIGRVALSKRAIQITDAWNDPEYEEKESARLGNVRAMLGVPLMRSGEPIGAFALARSEPIPFSEREVALVTTFADQAVIAIENARLFDEVQAKTRDLMEALTYQTGSSNILKVIASSPTDVAPVLKAIVESACELCDANDAIVHLRDGDGLRHHAHHGPIPVGFETGPINRTWTAGRAFLDRMPVHVHDVLSADGDQFREGQRVARLLGIRTILSVPLLRDNESIGTILLRRTEMHPFSDKQIALLRTFADQAVIAIENVRLFDEVQSRTRQLSESLQFQTASGEVLKVISRSPDTLQPVLDVIVETSRLLCNALTSVIFLLREGKFHDVAESSEKPDYIEALRANPIPLNKAGSVLARAAREKRTIHVANTAEDPEFGLGGPLDQGGPRSLLSVPLIQDGRVIGGIMLRQSHLTPFTPRQIEAVETFADQAVIAISNVNLFEQVQQRTRELAASLDDLRTAQDRLIQTEKLASLGQLTAGIAHEIKNPLNFVNNFSALSAELTDELNDTLKPVAMDIKIREEVEELTGMLKSNLEKVVQHGRRADSIVKNMLLHSREGSGEQRPADINALLDESLNLAYHGIRAEKPGFNITLQRDVDPNAGVIELFPQEITRAFLNLISNGFYAASKRKAENGEVDFEPMLSSTLHIFGSGWITCRPRRLVRRR